MATVSSRNSTSAAFSDRSQLAARALAALTRGCSDRADATVDTSGRERVRIRLGLTSLASDELEGADAVAANWCSKVAPHCGRCPMRRLCPEGRAHERRQTPRGSITFVDLFCGAGGLSLGLEQAGLRPVLALDHDQAALATYAHNRPSLTAGQVIDCDLAVVDGRDVSLPEAHLLVGGPPCQGFSTANRQRLADDARNTLYRAFLGAAARTGALTVVLENVPGMLRARASIEREMDDAGYRVEPFVLDCVDFGLPQRRRRLCWIGLRHDVAEDRHFERLRADLGPRTTNVTALRAAIGDLPPLEAKTTSNATHLENDSWGYTVAWRDGDGPGHRSGLDPDQGRWLFNHRTKYLNPRDRSIYASLRPGEDSSAEWFADVDPYPSRSGVFKDKFSRLSMDVPARTMTAHMYYDCHMYIHPEQPRGLTPREVARIQGFPDDYLFLGYPNEWYRQVGNAVSPVIGRAVGNAVGRLLREVEGVRAA